MQLRNTPLIYGSVSKFFHWLIAILIICMLVFGYFLGDVPKDYQPMTYNIHKLIGLTILLLMLLRLGWALMNVKPRLPDGTPCWQRGAERLTHFLLYVAVIGMPLFGWVGSVAAGHAPHIGGFDINLPIAQSKELADTAFTLHGYFAIVLIVLISIHALAALYHHFICRDDILRRML